MLFKTENKSNKRHTLFSSPQARDCVLSILFKVEVALFLLIYRKLFFACFHIYVTFVCRIKWHPEEGDKKGTEPAASKDLSENWGWGGDIWLLTPTSFSKGRNKFVKFLEMV